MTKKIIFKAMDPYTFEVQPRPVPASSLIPQWWKDAPPYDIGLENPTGSRLIIENNQSNASFKKCTPMLDMITAGYIFTLWADVQVRLINNEQRITWRVSQNVFTLQGTHTHNIPTPIGYGKNVFKYSNGWIPKTPKGYSVFVTSPVAFQDSPIRAIPAIIDSDKSNFEVAFPVWLKSNFEGVIPKGTPMAQVIPFKRENWESSFDSYKENEYQMEEDKGFNSTLINHYVKNIWSRKLYR
jgi:hypothetical protein